MKVSNSLVLALLVSSAFVTQSSFADFEGEEAVESIQSEDLGLDSIGEPPVRDHRGGGGGRSGGRSGGGYRPSPSRPSMPSRPPVVRDHRGGGRPGGGVVVHPTRPGRPNGGYRPGYPTGGYRPVRPAYPVVRHIGRNYGWAPWRHRVVVRNYYPFEWRRVLEVTCTARSPYYGWDYSVTEAGYRGEAYQNLMVDVENAALDRCYSETGGDEGCYLVGCTPNYSANYGYGY